MSFSVDISRRKALGMTVGATALGVLGWGSIPSAGAAQRVRLGVRGGIAEELWTEVAKNAKAKGLDVELVLLSGTANPNEALQAGDLDANAFQHVPYLNEQVRQRGYQIVAAGNTLFAPIAFYSRKYKSLAELPEGASVGIPNDVSNQSRVLVVLRDNGIIQLRDGFDPLNASAGLSDVTANPRKLKWFEAAQPVLSRSLPDLAAAAIIQAYASQIGLVATRNGIAVEKLAKNPYVNVIAVRTRDKDAPWVRTLVQSFQTDDIRRLIETRFQGSLIPAF